MTTEKKSTRSACLALGLIVLFLVAAIALVVELLRLYAPGLWEAFSSGDEAAIESFLDHQDRLYGAGLIWLLTFVQVLSIVIPAMPVQLAAGMAFGTWVGFALNFSAAVAANMTVFGIAGRATKLLREIGQEHPKVGNVLNSLSFSRNRTYYTVMALLIPGLPNGAIPYAAVNSGIQAKMFLTALLIALPLPTIMTCAAGDLALSGNLLHGLIMLAALWCAIGVLFLFRNSLPQRLERIIRAVQAKLKK